MDYQIQLAKVLPFRRAAARGQGGEAQRRKPPHDASSSASSRWYWLVWWALAWWIAMSHVRTTVARREVFGVEDTVAFLIAFVLPLLSAKTIISLTVQAVRAVRTSLRRR